MDNELDQQNDEKYPVRLDYDFNIIHNLITKSFLVPFSQIALVNSDFIVVKSNDQNVDGKSFLYQDTVYLESLLRSDVFTAQDIAVANLYQNVPFYASVPLYDSIGNIIGCLVIIDQRNRDFSKHDCELLLELANLTSVMLQQHLETERIKEVYTDFMHKAVHDLKNPLTSISLTAELLKRKSNDSEVVVKFAERIEKSNSKLFNNLAHLKTVFPHYNETFRPSIGEIDINHIFSDLKNSISFTEIKIENSLTEKIHGDYQRLKESMLLLVSQLISKSVKQETVLIKSYLKETCAVIEISGGNNAQQTLAEAQSKTAIHISRMLIELQKGSLDVNLAQKNNCCFNITFPLLHS